MNNHRHILNSLIVNEVVIASVFGLFIITEPVVHRSMSSL